MSKRKGAARPPPWTPFERAYVRTTGAELKRRMGHLRPEALDEEWQSEAIALNRSEVYKNSRYQVNVDRDRGDFVHLSVKRLDKEPIHDWRDLQRIKNEIVGPEHEAFELYPAESRVVDTANQFHLWVLKDAEATIPVGWREGLKVDADDAKVTGSKQRKLDT